MRDYDAAEIVCEACGCVIAEKLVDSRPEWRAFDDEQKAKRTRVGAPLTLPSTTKDSQRSLTGETNARVVRVSLQLSG